MDLSLTRRKKGIQDGAKAKSYVSITSMDRPPTSTAPRTGGVLRQQRTQKKINKAKLLKAAGAAARRHKDHYAAARRASCEPSVSRSQQSSNGGGSDRRNGSKRRRDLLEQPAKYNHHKYAITGQGRQVRDRGVHRCSRHGARGQRLRVGPSGHRQGCYTRRSLGGHGRRDPRRHSA
ncbi:hypothetical protein HPB48_003610 [Haemaphysalis longicornis]|uniref:Uncharacterized protein n=1 Tax=Haemaphysalis longicornis TaxID=44386 RepID=A0A9J6FDD4_HAELO|nr:hypothetical protein HPB48_003610 [Haemaphysalis longicornis]